MEFRKSCLKLSWDLFNFSVRAKRAFKELGVSTIEEIVVCHEEDFTKLKNCGRGTVQEIKHTLSQMGLSLRMKPEFVARAQETDKMS